jgi:lambda repressor-like predicted transcriptional regulator
MQHGTAVGWRWHRCRCDDCRRALLDEARLAWAMRRVRAGADPATRVPARWARRRVGELESAGMTRAQIARRAGVSPMTITRLADPTTKKISRITATAVLGVSA